MVFAISRTFIVLFFVFIFSAEIFANETYQYAHVRVRIQKDLLSYPKKLESYFGQYRRRYEIVHKESGKYDVIEIVPLEHYLAGVVSKEMPLTWPIEALKAQAVVARSYLFSRMNERQDKLYHVESDQMDQVFEWTNSSKAYQAVKSTEDVVLSLNKKIVKTFYHSDCGGHTLPANKVWTGAVDLGTAKDLWCGGRSKNQWSYTVPTSDLAIKDVQNIEFFENKLVSVGNMGIQKLRQVAGFAKVRSSPESVVVEDDYVTFSGRGFGHGVGLCQWGSLQLAKKGRNYLDVLEHYYPKANIVLLQKLPLKNYLTNNEIPKTINKYPVVYIN